ncbi:MAG: glutamate-1-semialdehyde-2,1-aminomutase [Deltaproteobacteria bacterium RIFOXYA12_FULL_58_15]|nr:MAG: glutamate-1-semialdehyde-2,1-aminomutase [Deltaproteobacteria bacterium RIFOXYA12_FULL_58_15]OGR13767.1 MAG: glutamate-1-semialdehyde-2,1-aminomutase [Deltaproteobacteria bacterium RIFOXYB12_FULL_58_9]
MKLERSAQLYQRAIAVIPGGVNSPVRAFNGVGGNPIFVTRAQGPYIYDADGQRFIDYVGSWGPLILGHAPRSVLDAVARAAKDGTSFGWATEREVELAEHVTKAVPSVEMVRFVSSGTEATMSALRVARGFTGRDRVVKFAGCYHGHADAFLADAGSGVATLGIPGCAGVPDGAVRDSLTVPYNDLNAVEATFSEHGDTIAAVIVEPVACNMGLVPPSPEFLPGLRSVCDKYGALLIFDEVITGFRLGLGGAQAHFGVTPDLTTFGKIIGGGLPVGAYGGRRDIMRVVAPLGPVYQAGTLSGNPLAMAAGIATLECLERPSFYSDLDSRAKTLTDGLDKVLASHGNIARVDRVASIFYLWFKPQSDRPARSYDEIKSADAGLFVRFFHALLNQGVTLAPSAFEVGFVSNAHELQHIEATITAVDLALKSVLG